MRCYALALLEPAVMHLIRFRIIFTAIAVAAPTAAQAQNYPWCSNFHDGAGTNCGFSSYEQCMATARGTGGYCAPNNSYVAPRPAMSSGRVQRKRKVPSSGR
jgi:Protein of unknown function (DUF3551)